MEVSALLLDLAIGVHHHAMYPSGHPSLQPAVDAVLGRLGGIFIDRRSFTVGAARRHLVVDGAATDPLHPALSELAQRIHKHHLGAVTFNRGISADELKEVMAALAMEVEIAGTPLGLLSTDDFPTWENARLFRVGYEDLELRSKGRRGPGGTDRATALWLGLAQMAMPEDVMVEYGPEGRSLAAHVQQHVAAEQREGIAEYVRQLAYELRGARGHAAEEVRRRLSDFLKGLDEDALQGLLHLGGSGKVRTRFLLDVNQSLSTDAVLRIVQAAATGGRQGISHSMTRLLSKLAVHAERGDESFRAMADTAVRDNVEALLQGWDLADPNPEAYTLELDLMSRAAPIFQAPDSAGESMGAERLIQMAVEVDADGEVVASAVAALVALRGVGPLLDLLDRAPPENRVAGRIRALLATPSQLRMLLAEERLDPRSLHVLVERMGPAAVEPLLDGLEDSDSRAVRRMIFDALAHLGPSVRPQVVQRLGSPHWFVLRNGLALLQRFEGLPDGLDAGPFLAHPDQRVRRAALPLALRAPERRDEVILAALADEDPYLVRGALLELRDGVPEHLQQTLATRVVLDGRRSDEIRALGAKVIAVGSTPYALGVLLKVVVAGRNLFGRPKIAPASPLVLAALRGLATGWPDDPDTRAVLRRARRSKDVSIAAAAEALEGAVAIPVRAEGEP